MDKAKAVRVNAVFYYLQFGFTALMTLLVSPHILNQLGVDLFGAWKTSQKILDISTLFDGRAAQTLKITLGQELGRGAGKVSRAGELVAAARMQWKSRMPLFLLAVIFLAAGIAVFIQGVAPEDRFSVAAYSLLFGFSLCISAYFGLEDAVLTADLKSYISSFVQVVVLICVNLTLYLAASLGDFSLPVFGLVAMLGAFVNLYLIRFFARRRVVWLKEVAPKDDVQSFFRGVAGWNLGWGGVEKVTLALDVILVAYFCGVSDVADYTFNTYILQLALVMALIATSAQVPILAAEIGREGGGVRDLISSIRRKCFFISVLAAALIISVNNIFVSLWVGEVHSFGSVFSLLIAFYFLQLALIRCDGQVLDAFHDVKSKTIYFGLAAICAIVFCFAYKLSFGSISVGGIVAIIILARLPLSFAISYSVRTKSQLMGGLSSDEFVLLLVGFIIFAVSVGYVTWW